MVRKLGWAMVGLMETKEFKAKVLRTEDANNIYLDLRPFGTAEAEAIDFFLQETLFAGSRRKFEKKVVVICEPTAKIPPSAGALINQINHLGLALELRPEHRETSE